MSIEFDELERAAYMAGDEQTLKLLARIAELEDEIEGWEEQASESESDASGAWDRVAELENDLEIADERIAQLEGGITMELYNRSTQPVRIHFTENTSPVDPRLTLLGELLDASGRRVWAGYGRHQAEILAHAAAWLDDCHGRAGHTPPIAVDQSWPFPLLAQNIQLQVQDSQAARLR